METLQSPQPKVIAFEGGPCGGKTTIITALARTMQHQHRSFALLPEAATEYINALQAKGSSPEYLATHDRAGYIDLETTILQRIVTNLRQARLEHRNTPTIIAADRIDIATYVQPEEYRTILGRLGRTASLLASDVDTVMYLPTLARTDPTKYEQLVHTNLARFEHRAEQAVATCQANLQAVQPHHDLRIYDQLDFNLKTNQVITDVLAIQDGITADAKLQ